MFTNFSLFSEEKLEQLLIKTHNFKFLELIHIFLNQNYKKIKKFKVILKYLIVLLFEAFFKNL